MALSLQEIITPETTDETLSTLTALAAVAGFPATAWQSGTVPRTFFELEALTLGDLRQLIGLVASGGFVDHAEGAWLTLRAAQGYNLQREPAVYARAPLRLTDVDGIGPVNITTPGQVVVASGERGEIRFRAVDDDLYPLPRTLPASGEVVVMFEAEKPGTSGNRQEGDSFEMVSSLPGVTVAQELTPGEPWLTQEGRDEESDPDLRLRCKARWKENGNAATEAAYKALAIKVSNLPIVAPERRVSRVAVRENTDAGTLTVYCASAAGSVESEVLSLIEPDIKAIRPQCVQVSVLSATPRTVQLAGSVLVKASQLDAAKAAVQKVVSDYFTTIPIGGFTYKVGLVTHGVVYLAPVEALALAANPGIVNLYLGDNFTNGEFELNPNEVAVPYFSGIKWVTA